MAIYLIRHGETAGNRDRIVQMPDTPLSERGLEQAERLARRLADHDITRIVASDFARAAMTADRISDAIGVAVEHDPVLQERHLGDVRGRPYAELPENPLGPDFEPPGGETWPAFHARVDRAWQRIREFASPLDGHLAIVTHGLVCHSIAARLLPLSSLLSLRPELEPSPAPNGPLIPFGNTALTIIQSDAPHHIDLFACTTHLDEDANTPAL